MGLMAVKDQFFNLVRFNLRDGSQIRFWEDTWLRNQPLSYRFPNLYNIVRKKHATVAKVFNTTPLNVSFRWALIGNILLEWNNRIATIANVNRREGYYHMDLKYKW